MCAQHVHDQRQGCERSAHALHEVAGREGLAAMHAYPASCIRMHHLLSDMQSLSDAQDGLIERVRRAHITHLLCYVLAHGGVARR